jgi:hypothetical protein
MASRRNHRSATTAFLPAPTNDVSCPSRDISCRGKHRGGGTGGMRVWLAAIEGIPCSTSTPISRSPIWLSGSSSIVAGRRGLGEEPLASQHPDPGVEESSHLIESGRDGLAGLGANNIKVIVTHRLFAVSMAWTNSLDPAPHFVKTLSAAVNGTSTGCTRSGGRM